MTLTLSAFEQEVISKVRTGWGQLSAEAKAEVAAVVKADLGFMAVHPWIYTAVTAGLGAFFGHVILSHLGL